MVKDSAPNIACQMVDCHQHFTYDMVTRIVTDIPHATFSMVCVVCMTYGIRLEVNYHDTSILQYIDAIWFNQKYSEVCKAMQLSLSLSLSCLNISTHFVIAHCSLCCRSGKDIGAAYQVLNSFEITCECLYHLHSRREFRMPALDKNPIHTQRVTCLPWTLDIQ